MKTHRGPKCPICGCLVVVWAKKNLTAKLCRLFYMADHMKTLHSEVFK